MAMSLPQIYFRFIIDSHLAPFSTRTEKPGFFKEISGFHPRLMVRNLASEAGARLECWLHGCIDNL